MEREPVGRFCWVDLAATDASRALGFYTELFGWDAVIQPANGGSFVRLTQGARDVGSLYPLRRSALHSGAGSHWTPYVRVDDVDAASHRALSLGAAVAVEPFVVDGMARIALIVDPVGAAIGLWEDLRA
jgi:predicted enzyme related to lactoylglutathione lyase